MDVPGLTYDELVSALEPVPTHAAWRALGELLSNDVAWSLSLDAGGLLSWRHASDDAWASVSPRRQGPEFVLWRPLPGTDDDVAYWVSDTVEAFAELVSCLDQPSKLPPPTYPRAAETHQARVAI